MAYSKIKKDGTPAKKPGIKPNAASTPLVVKKYSTRPHIWRCGPDEYKHNMYLPWLKSKAQANFRNEGWELTFDEFFELWNGLWHLRGKQRECYCMSRKDFAKPWNKDNAIVITRYEHLCKQAELRRAMGRTYYKRGAPGRPGKIVYEKLKIN